MVYPTTDVNTFEPSLTVREDGLVPIAVATLSAAENVDFQLYRPGDADSPPCLYRDRNYPLRQDDLNKLLERGVPVLYVYSADHDRYKRFVRDNLDVSLENEQIPVVQRYQMLQVAGRDLLAESYQQQDPDEAVRGASEVSLRITSLLQGRDLTLSSLFRVFTHDFNTFDHIMNVATYSLMLAERLGTWNESELNYIAVGALLHDLGKLQVPPAILNKSSRLTPEEWEIVRRHPLTGFEELCLCENLTEGQLMMVYQHHERLDGQGYPVGVRGEDIHLWAQLCAVVDVFDAMTANRPYRRAIPVPDVLEHLDKQVDIGLNKEMVQCFKALMQANQ